MKIVICGGGTAGWLSALFLSKIHPDNEYILIENLSIGVIGTGEGSTGVLRDVLRNNIWNFELSEEDFIKETGSVPKLGIEFRNWGKHNFISPLDGSRTSTENPDFFTLYGIINDLPPEDCSRQGIRAKLGKVFYKLGDQLLTTDGGAYHFDGVKVSQFFKNRCKSVEVIDDFIIDIQQDKFKNVRSIICQNRTINDVDLIIDCLGFNSIFSDRLNKGWVDYSKYLPVNSAILFQRHNTDIENTKALTISTAMKNGWVFEIPVEKRYGCGYVYCDKFCTEEEAVQELIESGFDITKSTYRKINFKTGRVKEFWKNNVISIGLSSGFLEPLQATSIHTTIAHLNLICFSYLTADEKSTYNQSKFYNRKAAKYFDDFADFVNLHYQCGRDDTEFWKYMTTKSATPFVKDLISLCKSRVPDIDDYNQYPLSASSLFNSTLHGLGLISKKVAKQQWDFYSQYKPVYIIEQEFKHHQKYFNELDPSWTMKEFMIHYHIEPYMVDLNKNDDLLDQILQGKITDEFCAPCMAE